MRDPADIATRIIETGTFLIGYARFSTRDQGLTNQETQLRSAGCGTVFTEKITDTRRARPRFDHRLAQLRAGDVFVVTRLDPLARSPRDPLDIVERARETGAGLCRTVGRRNDTGRR